MKRAILLAVCALASCTGASSDPGLRALVHIDDAQFVTGALPAEGNGPGVLAAGASHTFVRPSESDEQIRGTIAATGEAVVIGVDNDVGYWVLPADAPDPQVPGNLPTFVADVSIAARALGPLDVIVEADDRNLTFGKRAVIPLVVADLPPADAPLSVTLGWDVDADLDLHVIQPDGVEIWWGNINSYQKPGPGEPPDPPTAFRSGAVLDIDSNQNCVRDGRNLERAAWPTEPAEGTYVVRVEASSLCDFIAAHWWVTVDLHGQILAAARGVSVAGDTRELHGEGAGVTALDFHVDAPPDAGPLDAGL